MGIIKRFKDIMSANVNAMLEKCEDPEKMLDQYLRNAKNDLAAVTGQTAEVMAIATESMQKVEQAEASVAEYEKYIEASVKAGNDKDATAFIKKRDSMEFKLESLRKDEIEAKENSLKMIQMRRKLSDDIAALEAKRDAFKSRITVAQTRQVVANTMINTGVNANIENFDRVGQRVNRMMNKADALEALSRDTAEDDPRSKYDVSGNNEKLARELEEAKQKYLVEGLAVVNA